MANRIFFGFFWRGDGGTWGTAPVRLRFGAGPGGSGGGWGEGLGGDWVGQVGLVRLVGEGLGEHWELVEVGVSLFEEGVLAFLGFVHEVVHEGGVAGKFHEAVLAVEFGIEGTFDHAYG